MARVTGIGGVFFKSTSDHKRLAAWYRDNLGMALEDWRGAILKWPEDHAEDHGVTYVLDAQFERFLQHNRPLLPEWFLDAAHAALHVSPDW